MPTPSVGRKMAASTPCPSITARRASRLRYSGRMGSSSPNNFDGSALLGLRPRKYSSITPGAATGSKVGLGMNLLIFSPTSRRCRPLSVTHCSARLRYFGSRYRVNASSAS